MVNTEYPHLYNHSRIKIGTRWVEYFITLIIVFISILLEGCLKIDDQIITQEHASLKKGHSLIYQVEVGLKDSGEVFIEYHEATDTTRKFSDLIMGRKALKIYLIGLKAKRNYHYIIHAKVKGKLYRSKVFEFQTGELPPGLPELNLLRKTISFDGYILLKTFFNPGAVLMIDENSDIVWYHLYDTTTVRAFNFSTDQKIFSLIDSSLVECLDLYGNVIRQYQFKNADVKKVHHDVLDDIEQRVVALTYTHQIADLTSHGGYKNDTIIGDGIIILDQHSNKIWDWNIFDHADPLADDSIFYLKKDWSHANSINYDEDGNFLISFRNLNQVWKIDYKTGKVIWKLGMNGDFTLATNDSYFIHQHDVHINRFGDIMMFDNGLNYRGFSRILSLKFIEEDNLWKTILNIQLDKDRTTFRMGSARFIDDHHILVSSPKRTMQLSIINAKGETVWNAVSSKSSYRAIYIEPGTLNKNKWF